METCPGGLWNNSLHAWTLCTRSVRRWTNGKTALIHMAVNKQAEESDRREGTHALNRLKQALSNTWKVTSGWIQNVWLEVWATILSYVNYCFDLGVFFLSKRSEIFFVVVVTQPSVSSDWRYWEEQSKSVVRTQETCAAGNTGIQRDTQVAQVLMWKKKQPAPACKPNHRAALAPLSQHSPRISIENRWLALHNACNPMQTLLLKAWFEHSWTR